MIISDPVRTKLPDGVLFRQNVKIKIRLFVIVYNVFECLLTIICNYIKMIVPNRKGKDNMATKGNE